MTMMVTHAGVLRRVLTQLLGSRFLSEPAKGDGFFLYNFIFMLATWLC